MTLDMFPTYKNYTQVYVKEIITAEYRAWSVLAGIEWLLTWP
jgi:hypothetical protein